MHTTKYEKLWMKILEAASIEKILGQLKEIVLQVVVIPGSPELLHSGVATWWEVIIDDTVLLRFRGDELAEIEMKNKFFYTQENNVPSQIQMIVVDYQRMLSVASCFKENSAVIYENLLVVLPLYLEERDTKQKRRNTPFSAKITCNTCHACEYGISLILSSTAACAKCS